MKQRSSLEAIRCGLLAMALLALLVTRAGVALAAKSTSRDLELGEVLVEGQRTRPVRDPQKIIDWMRRLVGQFRYQGFVELHDDKGATLGQQRVSGKADCVAFGLAPGVQCTVKIEWPEAQASTGQDLLGAVSRLDPAMVLYGLDPDELAVHYLQVDNQGVADGGLGYLRGDTMTTRDPCVEIPGDCTRTTKIMARPDGQMIQTQIDIEKNGVLAVRYLFVQRPIMRFKTADEP
jgi:hypothetical protein